LRCWAGVNSSSKINNRGFLFFNVFFKLLDLSGTQKSGRVEAGQRYQVFPDNFQIAGLGQAFQFLKRYFRIRSAFDFFLRKAAIRVAFIFHHQSNSLFTLLQYFLSQKLRVVISRGRQVKALSVLVSAEPGVLTLGV